MNLEQENLELRETLEIMSDPEIMKRFKSIPKNIKTKPLSEIIKQY